MHDSRDLENLRYGDRIQILQNPTCDGSSLYESAEADLDPDSTEWVAGFESPVHDDIAAVQSHVQPPSPETGESHPVRPFIGYDVDEDRLEVVVVVDPSEDVDYTNIASDLEAITSEVNLRVERGCHPLSHLNHVLDALTDREVLGSINDDGSGYMFGIDAESATVHIATQKTNEEFIQYFEERFGDLVSFRFLDGHVSELAGTRNADISPHYGAARIASSATNSGCTSGLAVDFRGGPRVMTTAGHCGVNAQAIRNGAGGPYGTMRNRQHPNPDLARIEGRTYHRYIYAGGTTAGTKRIIDRKMEVGVNTHVCLTGATSGFFCGSADRPIRVLFTNMTVCRNNNQLCSTGVAVIRRDGGGTIVRSGDSGSPAFGRHGHTASARGIVVMGMVCDQINSVNRCGEGAVQPVSRIETTMNVRIATKPGLEW